MKSTIDWEKLEGHVLGLGLNHRPLLRPVLGIVRKPGGTERPRVRPLWEWLNKVEAYERPY